MISQSEKEPPHCYIVVGGELEYVHQTHYRDLTKLIFVGAYADREEAKSVWRSRSQKDVDNAHMRYQIVKVY